MTGNQILIWMVIFSTKITINQDQMIKTLILMTMNKSTMQVAGVLWLSNQVE